MPRLSSLSNLARCLPLAVGVLLFPGCGKRESIVERGNREGVLHLSIGSEPSDLDPHIVSALADGKVIQSLFEPLVTFEPGTLEARPALAERWEISPDGLTYTFHFRADAKWSNGETVTAQDCVDSYRRILTPSLAANYAYFLYLLRGAEAFNKGETKDFSTVGATATDARTLVLALAHPAPYFLQVLLNSCWRPINVRSIDSTVIRSSAARCGPEPAVSSRAVRSPLRSGTRISTSSSKNRRPITTAPT